MLLMSPIIEKALSQSRNQVNGSGETFGTHNFRLLESFQVKLNFSYKSDSTLYKIKRSTEVGCSNAAYTLCVKPKYQHNL
ncbi:hypothetical protein ACU8KH_01607 [Lachancea thermotolerans]